MALRRGATSFGSVIAAWCFSRRLRQGPSQIAGAIALRPARGDGVPEHLPGNGPDPVCSFQSAPAFYPAKDRQKLRGLDFVDQGALLSTGRGHAPSGPSWFSHGSPPTLGRISRAIRGRSPRRSRFRRSPPVSWPSYGPPGQCRARSASGPPLSSFSPR